MTGPDALRSPAPCARRRRTASLARRSAVALAPQAAGAGGKAPTHHPRRRDRAAPARLRRADLPGGRHQRRARPRSSSSTTAAFNAFVANGQKIFINVGALMDAETPNEIIGVLAHETGHIAGGHLARLREQIANAQILSVVGMLLGAGAMAGAAPARATRSAMPAPAPWACSPAARSWCGATSSPTSAREEQAADHAAMRYLEATGQSPKGMLDDLRALRRRRHVPLARARPLPPQPPAADRARRASSRRSPSRARISTRRTRRPSRRATT